MELTLVGEPAAPQKAGSTEGRADGADPTSQAFASLLAVLAASLVAPPPIPEEVTVTQAPAGGPMPADVPALKDNTVTPPPDQAAFRIDYPAWLAHLGARNRLLVE